VFIMYEIPLNDVEVKIENDYIVIKGKLGSTKKKFNKKFVNVELNNGKLIIKENDSNKKIKKFAYEIANALNSEIKRAIESVNKGIELKMVVVSAHFPMKLSVKDNKLVIENIFGERVPRYAKIIGDTKVDIKGQEVYLHGVDIYDVKQTAANIMRSCRNTPKDPRIFQDGIYLVKEE